MAVAQSCSWCHTMNDITTGPTLCRECGHRADLCRMDCDCPVCLQSYATTGAALNRANVADSHLRGTRVSDTGAP